MKILKATNKNGQKWIETAKNNEGYTLYDVYGTFSQAKYNAYSYCLNLCHNENGYDLRIISHNTFGFSVAWDICDETTGEIVALRVETPNNSYKIIY